MIEILLSDVKAEPVLTQGVIQATIGLLMSFGLHLSTEQMGAILVFTAALLSWLTRQHVQPMVNQQPEKAMAATAKL